MATFQTDYQSLLSCNEELEATPDHDVIFHVPPEKSRWNHIEDLDSFFRKVYRYHQKHGFFCILTSEVYGLIQFIFIVLFTVYIGNCVDYDAVGRQISYQNATYIEKLKFTDLLIPAHVCVRRLGTFTWICVVVAIVFWIYYLCRTVCCAISFHEIKLFYNTALKIPCSELDNTTWHEVQCKLREVQHEQQMCIHKQDLSELDIYHRILRHENYMVAMVNKNILPVKYNIKPLGEVIYFSSGLRYNIEMLLFRSPISPFKSTWQLKEDYKKFNKRVELAERLSKYILLLGIMNFFLFPFIFLWHLLSFCVNYAGHIRKEPGFLGARKWSLYSRLYLRHFNELDHELTARLSRAYNPACHYMSSFSSHLLTIHARNISGFAGVIAVFIILWSAIQNDVIEIEYVITTGAVASFICHAALCLVPNENLVFVPETLMTKILADIHYMPDCWKNKAHTVNVRNEFSQIFQLKMSYILEQLLSPLVTPLILIFYIRHRSLDIIDFFRSFTVEVTGVGDVCSFALMDISRHGNNQWIGDGQTKADLFQQAENGKTELSLIHFTVTNPDWQPPPSSNMFINNLREKAQRDAGTLLDGQLENPLFISLHSLHTVGSECAAYVDDLTQDILRQRMNQNVLGHSMFASRVGPVSAVAPYVSGGVSLSEGPLYSSQAGILSSLHTRSPHEEETQGTLQRNYDTLNPMEYRAAEMSLSALYLHELHHRRLQALRHPVSLEMQQMSTQRGQGDEGATAGKTNKDSEQRPLLESKTASRGK